ncbi:MAG TPA: lycopene cyclase family protein [Lacibacter sp.]|nr:lycopene cyclase family protein [Lacibacter sp.]HMO88152.1 lycopene cyclase family protein [Lacibacter sp.]HMP86009.1 lycopene cyclase family protein [Lacibacter sp.]
MQDHHYDIIITGGGAAGRILLHFLSAEDYFRNWRILVLESGNRIHEKTWCFWKKDTHPFEHLICKEWTDLSFAGTGYAKSENIAPYSYCCIRGADFDNYFNQQFFPAHPNVTLVNDTVVRTTQHNDGWTVQTSTGCYTGSQVISNLAAAGQNNRLLQHFFGWFIEYDTPVFDPGKAVLMDFSTVHGDNFCFYYVLPFSEKKALVECTYYSGSTLPEATYTAQLDAYILKQYGPGFRRLQTERGAIPLIEEAPSVVAPDGSLAIGQSAGMIKASTGYAFQRMTEDARLLAASIGKTQQRRRRHNRFRFYDRLLLSIIREEPAKAVAIFQRLFEHRRISEILTFLDEDSCLRDEIKIFSQLPWWPFLKRIHKSL